MHIDHFVYLLRFYTTLYGLFNDTVPVLQIALLKIKIFPVQANRIYGRVAAAFLDQVLIFTTVGDVRPEKPGIPGVKMFLVEEGAVREI